MSKFARQISIVGALLLLFGGAMMFRYFSAQKKPPPRKEAVVKALREVSTFSVTNKNIATSIEVQGRLVAFDKMQIFSEVQGRLIETGRPFKVGSYFRKGDVLLKIDDSENRLAILSQKASLMNAITNMMPDLKLDYPESFGNWEAYLNQFDVNHNIKAFPEPANDKEKFFVSARNLHSQYYNIKSQEERLSKYTVTAPFSGVLTNTSITPGSLVRAGQPMGELMNNGNYELEATVRLEDLNYIKTGNVVQLNSPDLGNKWSGRIKRISDQIDPNTQTVIAYIGVNGKNLREGMFLNGTVQGKTVDNAIEIPKLLLVNQNQVFKVMDKTSLLTQEVQVLGIKNGMALVKGLTNGDVLLENMFPGAYNGQKVKVVESDNTAGAAVSSVN